MKVPEGVRKRRFGSVEEIERVFFPRLYKERCRSEGLARELQESDEALTLCEEAHGAVLGNKEKGR